MTIQVSFVDDSPTARSLLNQVITNLPGMAVLACAEDAFSGWKMIKKAKPAVLVLDVNMPGMSGLDFLRKLMTHFPMPVVLVSGTSTRANQLATQALQAGAVGFVPKPDGQAVTVEAFSRSLAKAIRTAAGVANGLAPRVPVAAPSTQAASFRAGRYIVIGASTGGTHALTTFLQKMPENAPGVAIVQHMPSPQTRLFAERLNSICPMTVMEAQPGQKLSRGTVLLSPGSHHMELVGTASQLVVRPSNGPEVSGHRPSVDVLFRSCVRVGPKKFSAVILTGMGSDGALGMAELHDGGATTFAQDEASCVVYGMPGAAVRAGAIDTIASIEDLPAKVLDSCAIRRAAQS